MSKFLSIPVTNEQNQLVGLDGLVLVEQGSTTTVVMTYQGGKVVTLTHAAAGAGDETQRDYIEASVLKALKLKYWKPEYQCDALPYAVSGIAVA
jgi:hypothetical protein